MSNEELVKTIQETGSEETYIELFHNIRPIIIHEAEMYKGKIPHYGLEDYIQEGNLLAWKNTRTGRKKPTPKSCTPSIWAPGAPNRSGTWWNTPTTRAAASSPTCVSKTAQGALRHQGLLHHDDVKAVNTEENLGNVSPIPGPGGKIDGGKAEIKIPALSWNVIRFVP